MGKGIYRLSAKQVEHAKDGDHNDGGGLLLRIRSARVSSAGKPLPATAAWVFRYTSPTGKKARREMGLGPLNAGDPGGSLKEPAGRPTRRARCCRQGKIRAFMECVLQPIPDLRPDDSPDERLIYVSANGKVHASWRERGLFPQFTRSEVRSGQAWAKVPASVAREMFADAYQKDSEKAPGTKGLTIWGALYRRLREDLGTRRG